MSRNTDGGVGGNTDCMGSFSAEEITNYDRSPQTFRARSLLFLCVHGIVEMSTVEIAGGLRMSQMPISCSSKRGERIARRQA